MNQISKVSGIYLITNRKNNLKYVGQSRDIKKRIREHFSGSFNSTTLIDSAIAQDPDAFTWEIIKECPIEDLDYYEQYYIYYLNSMNFGYNRSFGGNSASSTIVSGEDHPKTYYTNQEMLDMRKEYVSTTINELYNKYKRGQSFYTFKNQLLNTYTNLPRYNKKAKRWIYPPDWDNGVIETTRVSTNTNISENEIMEVRRLSVTKTIEDIIKTHGLAPFSSERQLRDAVNGVYYKWLPFFSQKHQKWIYPDNWQGSQENEIDDVNWLDFFLRKERTAGRKLSNYQVLQIRYLNSLGYTATKILALLHLADTCSRDALYLIIHNKTYTDLPCYINGAWSFPENLNQLQQDNFPKLINQIDKELKAQKIIEVTIND